MSRRVRRKRHRQAGSPQKAAASAKDAPDNAAALDALAPPPARPGEEAAGLRQPPDLIVEPPERLAARRARDERDGVSRADPRRLYVGLAVFVAVVLLVFAILGFIESRDLMPAVLPSP